MAQHAAITAFGASWRFRRMGGDFNRYRSMYASSEWKTATEWKEWQEEALRWILDVAWRAPYYRSRWTEIGLQAADLQSITLEGIDRLPLVTKDEIRVRPADFCPLGRPPPGSVTWHTSGSTGTPLKMFHGLNDLRRALALRDARYGSFAGVNWRIPRATISGRSIVPDPLSTGPFYRYNLAERQTYISAYHLGPHTLPAYVHALERHGPEWINGYPSTLHEIARLAEDQGIPLPRMRAVVTIAEPLGPVARDAISRSFGCSVTEEYALAEEAAFGLSCERGSLHICPDGGYVEVLRPDGTPADAGEVGEIVATGFVRAAQPFIRYRTGDLAAWAPERCACGRSMPVLEALEGRIDDALIGIDGRRVGRLSGVPKRLAGVARMQLVQDRVDRVEARVVPDGSLEPAVEVEIRRRLKALLGDAMNVDVHVVDQLERTANGKVRTVIRRV